VSTGLQFCQIYALTQAILSLGHPGNQGLLWGPQDLRKRASGKVCKKSKEKLEGTSSATHHVLRNLHASSLSIFITQFSRWMVHFSFAEEQRLREGK
jgi:hypothetical protein